MAEAQELVNRRIGESQTGGEREETFRLIFDRYYRSVYRFFEKRGFSTEECQDLTQETFLRVYKGMATFRGEARFETWLF
jgi:RNA polymerase sigma-70 factor (ECF subfamily)